MNSHPFTILKEKIDQLIKSNIELQKQREIYAEKLKLKDGEIERLQRQCRKYEIQKEEAKSRINHLINLLKDIGIG